MASTEWLEYADPIETAIITPFDEEEQAPERPEAFDILMQLRRFHLSWSAGGFEDQPWLLIQELNAVCEAEEEHLTIKSINQRNWIESQKKNQNAP